MEVVKAVKEARSIRKFKKDPIPERVICEMLEDARWSPSWGNTQPCELFVITGEAMETLKKANRQKNMGRAMPMPDIAMPLEWPQQMDARYKANGKDVFAALNIARDDKEARARYNTEMFYLFDAPCLIVAVQDKAVTSKYALLDAGLILQTIRLLAHDRGFGTCMMFCAVAYPDVLRTVAKIPETKTIVMGIVLGYPDMDAPVNQFKRSRAAIDEFVTWAR
jgi:nitroreductase